MARSCLIDVTDDTRLCVPIPTGVTYIFIVWWGTRAIDGLFYGFCDELREGPPNVQLSSPTTRGLS